MSEKKRKSASKPRSKGRRNRPTIGVLLDNPLGYHGYHDMLIAGVLDAAKEKDANLVCFSGRALRVPTGHWAQENAIYELISPHAVNGLIIPSPVGTRITNQEFKAFCERHHPLPVVMIGLQVEGIKSVSTDTIGVYEAVTHLIETHGHRRIVFIQGPMRLAGPATVRGEAGERYQAYVTALRDHGIDLDPTLVIEGQHTRESGVAALRRLIDDRELRPGIDFGAVAAGNDEMALGVIDELRARGISVPYDIAVVGFDDVVPARFNIPPLTTARQPLYEIGKRAVETVLALLAGDPVPDLELLSSQLVVRQSCGCMTPAVTQAAAGSVQARRSKPKTALAAQREEILAEMMQPLGADADRVDPAWTAQLLDSLTAEIAAAAEKKTGAFLPTLDRIMRQVSAAGADVATWQDVLSALRRRTLPYFNTAEASAQIDDLLDQARVMVAEMTIQTQAQRRAQIDQQREALQQVNQELVTSLNVESLLDALVDGMPHLDIPSYYLSLYGDPQNPAAEARLLLAYRDHESVMLNPEGLPYPAFHLVPADLLPQGRRYDLLVKALHLREQQLGFAVLEFEMPEDPTYEMLRLQISSALHSMLIVQQLERRDLQLQTATEVSQAAGSTLDLDELIQRVVNLARERFDLYYAGLFLVDESGEWTGQPHRWAVLRAGTGDPGRQMLARGHRLEIGGESMIGQCVAHKQARIALDVGGEAVRFDNPFLPETRSELALPLISRGEAIGALTIQSAQEAAFTQEDIAVLQTLADQLANAVTNARLFAQTQEALEEMEATQRRYLQQAWGEYERTAEATDYETTHLNLPPLGDAVTPEIRQALEQQQVTAITGDGTGRSALVAPVILRGAVLGVLGVHDEDRSRQWSEDEKALVAAIAERMALAAENLRLIEQTQRRAARERLTREITDKMRRSASIEGIVQTALDELYGALGTSRVFVRLGAAEPPQDGEASEEEER